MHSWLLAQRCRYIKEVLLQRIATRPTKFAVIYQRSVIMYTPLVTQDDIKIKRQSHCIYWQHCTIGLHPEVNAVKANHYLAAIC